MKKILSYLSIILVILIATTNKVLAADFNISLTSNTVTVGNTVTLKIDGSASGLTGRFNISTSNSNIASISTNNVWVENSVESVIITAKNAGSATITVTPTDGISDKEANEPHLNSRSIRITVNGKQNYSNNNNNNTYIQQKSSNNFLTSLTIDNFKINEAFDKENLEYTLTVPANTEKIKINAQLADSTATLTGVGEVKVVTGINNLEVIVTAQNGSKRIYKINVTVEESKPIKVMVNNVEYTVVRKRKELPKISEYFEEKEIIINDESIEGYYNEKLDYTLIGLKDKKGNIDYYIYKNNKYTLYKEYTFNGTVLQIIDKEMKKGYKKTNFIYDNEKITSYQAVKLNLIKNTYAINNNDITGNQFYLFYAKNIETGKTNLYQYDALEKTVQRYNVELLNMYKANNTTYYTYTIISSTIILFLIVSIIILLIKNKAKIEKMKTKSIKKRSAL